MTSRARGATVAAADAAAAARHDGADSVSASEIAAPEESSAGTPFAEEHEVEGRNAAYEAALAEEATGDMAPRSEATAEAETQPVSDGPRRRCASRGERRNGVGPASGG